MSTFKIALASIGLLTVLGLSPVRAEVKLTDSTEIQGSWLLETVAPGLTKPKVEENRTWEFRKDGILKTSGYNRHLGMDNEQQFNYQVVNGNLKVMTLGGGSKPTEYKVYEKTDSSMILQGGLEGFYFFKKK